MDKGVSRSWARTTFSALSTSWAPYRPGGCWDETRTWEKPFAGSGVTSAGGGTGRPKPSRSDTGGRLVNPDRSRTGVPADKASSRLSISTYNPDIGSDDQPGLAAV